MKYFYSYYPTKNSSDEEVLFTLLSIKLSSIFLHKKNKKIGIYSDKKTIDLLKEYEIELDFYENIENEIKNISSEKLFAVCKIYSNIIQKEPFIQLDTDLFLFDNFNFKSLETSDISFYTLEQVDSEASLHHYNGWLETYLNSYRLLSNDFPHIVYEKYINPFYAYNCAIVGGKNYKIFSNMYTPIFEFIKNNKPYLENLDKHPMALLEQYIITGYLKKFGYNLSNINFVSMDRIPYIYVDNDTILYQIDKHNKIILSEHGREIDYENKNILSSLIRHKFNTSLHLNGAKGNIDIKQFVYAMLHNYDPNYVKHLEKKIGIRYDFQKISISENISTRLI